MIEASQKLQMLGLVLDVDEIVNGGGLITTGPYGEEVQYPTFAVKLS